MFVSLLLQCVCVCVISTFVALDRPVDLTVLSEKVKAGHSAATVLNSELPLFRATPGVYIT